MTDTTRQVIYEDVLKAFGKLPTQKVSPKQPDKNEIILKALEVMQELAKALNHPN